MSLLNFLGYAGTSHCNVFAKSLSHQTPVRLTSCRVIVFETQKQLWPDALPVVTNDFYRIQTQGLWVTSPVFQLLSHSGSLNKKKTILSYTVLPIRGWWLSTSENSMFYLFRAVFRKILLAFFIFNNDVSLSALEVLNVHLQCHNQQANEDL